MRELCWGDVKLKQTPDGKEYLEYSVERQTKTRTGSDPRDIRKIKPRMYSAPNQPAERSSSCLQILCNQVPRKHEDG